MRNNGNKMILTNKIFSVFLFICTFCANCLAEDACYENSFGMPVLCKDNRYCYDHQSCKECPADWPYSVDHNSINDCYKKCYKGNTYFDENGETIQNMNANDIALLRNNNGHWDSAETTRPAYGEYCRFRIQCGHVVSYEDKKGKTHYAVSIFDPDTKSCGPCDDGNDGNSYGKDNGLYYAIQTGNNNWAYSKNDQIGAPTSGGVKDELVGGYIPSCSPHAYQVNLIQDNTVYANRTNVTGHINERYREKWYIWPVEDAITALAAVPKKALYPFKGYYLTDNDTGETNCSDETTKLIDATGNILDKDGKIATDSDAQIATRIAIEDVIDEIVAGTPTLYKYTNAKECWDKDNPIKWKLQIRDGTNVLCEKDNCSGQLCTINCPTAVTGGYQSYVQGSNVGQITRNGNDFTITLSNAGIEAINTTNYSDGNSSTYQTIIVSVTKCEKGYYCPETETQKLKCPNGTTTKDTGATKQSDCIYWQSTTTRFYDNYTTGGILQTVKDRADIKMSPTLIKQFYGAYND